MVHGHVFEDASGTLQPIERKRKFGTTVCVHQIQKKIFYFLLFRDCFNLVKYKLNIREKKNCGHLFGRRVCRSMNKVVKITHGLISCVSIFSKKKGRKKSSERH